MPELCRFFGIVIRMYVELTAQHHLPHFHVRYQNHEAVYGIDSVERMEGSLPRRQQRLVEAWAEIHQAELKANWERLQNMRLPVRIDPLS